MRTESSREPREWSLWTWKATSLYRPRKGIGRRLPGFPSRVVAWALWSVAGIALPAGAEATKAPEVAPRWEWSRDGAATGAIIEPWSRFGKEELRPAVRRKVEEDGRAYATLAEVAAQSIAMGRLAGEPQAWNERAVAILDALLEDLPPEAAVTPGGAAEPGNLRLRDATLEAALRYTATGSPEDAARAAKWLGEFAAQLPHWPIASRGAAGSGADRRWVSQEKSRLYLNRSAGGLWGRWYPLDLRLSLPLLRAYDLIAPTLPPAERETIVSGIFDFIVDLNARWEPSYHNTDPYIFEALARFGLVLNRPEWVHRAVRHAEELLAIGFSPDGLWCEATPAYHRQVTGYYGVLARLLDGYSDPEGFRDPISGARFDRLDLTRRWAPAVARMQQGLDKLTLPDGFLAAINDSDPDRYPGSFAGGGGGDLLGTSGFAILTGDEGRDRVILNFGGTYGHEHGDVNGLLWYALGERRFDETRYRPLRGSGSTRKWSSSTAAHNTVVIDESNQANRFVHQRPFGPDDAMAGRTIWPGRETNGGTDHTGDLLLFDGEGEVQVVEVEGKKAYHPVAERYRRTLVKVDLGGGGGYLVDLFRVKGGRVHDYLLHGPLHRPYTAHVSLPLEERPDPGPAKESPARPFDYLRVVGEARTGAAPWHLTFSTPDGRHTRSWFLGPRDALVRSCLAPAINRPGDAPFVAFRHEAGESLYVVVHEAYADRPRVREAKLLGTGADGEAAVMVRLQGRTDVILSTPEPDGSITARWAEGAEAALTGRLGFLQFSGKDARKALLWDGTALTHGPVKLKARFPALEGVVRRTLRKEAGDPVDALELAFLKGEGVPPSGAAIHVRFGDGDGTGRVWSYRITGLPDERQTGFRVAHDPGFEIRENGMAKMLFHPGWGVPGGATFRIPLRATWIAPAPSSTTSAL